MTDDELYVQGLVDPIISEARAVRDAHEVRFDYDVAAIFRDI